ncbi:MAG TPA: MMPL family transporter [Trebonia sp.]|nr:MMPL family transporter [Trebonia sp.]
MSTRDGLLGGLGRASYRHRKATLLTWVAGVAVLITLWMRFGAAADNSFQGADPGQTLLNQHFARQSGDALTLAINSAQPITAPAVREHVAAALVPFEHAANVTSVTDPYTTPGHVSRDGHIAYATVQFDIQQNNIPAGETTALMNDATKASGHGVTFSLGGDVVDTAETSYGGPTDGIGIGAAMVVLLIAFGSLLAAGLPVATALFGIGGGLSLIALLGHVFPAPSFSPIVAALIGLGVGVDYALFILTRFRTELRAGNTPEQATVAAMRTAGVSVLTAGTTVVIGMLGLLVLRQQLLNGVAVAAAATVAMTVLGALTLLPALLGFSGTRLGRTTILERRRHNRESRDGTRASRSRSERWALFIQRHKVAAALSATVFILLLAAPVLSMKLSFPDESAQARGTMGYASYSTMARGFGPGFDAPLIVAAGLPAGTTAPAATADMNRVEAALARTPGVAAVTPPVLSRDGQAALLIAYPTTGAQDAATNALANTISGQVLPKATAGTGINVYLTGPNAANITFSNLISQRLPWLIAAVVGLSMLLLLYVFRSVVIAVKAAVMNLLSITASFGVLTAVTQWGWAGRVFGFPERMPVTTWVPVFLFVILFGLSMDYEVFLLSRIREAYLVTRDNAGAVVTGVASTARVITAAAAIMVVVFLSFDVTPDVSVKQIGLGLAVAVLIDATVVRLVLVPAVMELLGKANWWMPSWLARALPAPAQPDRDRVIEPAGTSS